MTSCEEELFVRAEMLNDTSDLAAEVEQVLVGASGAGLDPAAITSLRAAVPALDPAGGVPRYSAGKRTDQHSGNGYRSDVEFLEAVTDAEAEVNERLRFAGKLRDEADAAADKALYDHGQAHRDLQSARMALAAACALPTWSPCRDGCHPHKASAIEQAERAIADAEQRITDATGRLSLLEAAAEILNALAERLEKALKLLRRVPHDLGETYELIAEFIRRGGKMPHAGRWITGEGDAASGRAARHRTPTRASSEDQKPKAGMAKADQLAANADRDYAQADAAAAQRKRAKSNRLRLRAIESGNKSEAAARKARGLDW